MQIVNFILQCLLHSISFVHVKYLKVVIVLSAISPYLCRCKNNFRDNLNKG